MTREKVRKKPVQVGNDAYTYGLPPNRRCHDCGKPTNNYRCRECDIAHKRKCGVSLYGDLIYGD